MFVCRVNALNFATQTKRVDVVSAFWQRPEFDSRHLHHFVRELHIIFWMVQSAGMAVSRLGMRFCRSLGIVPSSLIFLFLRLLPERSCMFLNQVYNLFFEGWSSLVARLAHNQQVAGSSPAPSSISRVRAVWLARQIHDLEVAGSNPAPATKSYIFHGKLGYYCQWPRCFAGLATRLVYLG